LLLAPKPGWLLAFGILHRIDYVPAFALHQLGHRAKFVVVIDGLDVDGIRLSESAIPLDDDEVLVVFWLLPSIAAQPMLICRLSVSGGAAGAFGLDSSV
jgi:hypothetical protein